MHKFNPFLSLFLCVFFLTLCQAENLDKNDSLNQTDTFILSPVSITADKNSLDIANDKDILGKDKILNSGDLAKSFLNVVGFSMTRKGGGGSEILFRSQGASRMLPF